VGGSEGFLLLDWPVSQFPFQWLIPFERGHNPFTEMRKNFLTQRPGNLWNSLPQKAVESKSLNIFKEEMDFFLDFNGFKQYVENMALR